MTIISDGVLFLYKKPEYKNLNGIFDCSILSLKRFSFHNKNIKSYFKYKIVKIKL